MADNNRVIANPPIGIYDNPDINIGQAYYHVILDLIARYKTKFNGDVVKFPSFSFNVFGKKSERLITKDVNKSDFYKTAEENAFEIVCNPSYRSKLNLISEERLVDNEKLIVVGVSNDFKRLYDLGFIAVKGPHAYLNCAVIRKKCGLLEKLEEIEIYPSRIKEEMNRMIENNTNDLVKISRSTIFSPSSPINTENIGPLFTLANLWDHKYPNSKITMAGSNNAVSRYIFLRFLSRSALEDNPGMDEIFIWPRLIVTGNNNKWDLEKLTEDPIQTDIFRHAVISSHSNNSQKIYVDASRLAGSRNFIYLVANIRRVLNVKVAGLVGDNEFSIAYQKDMEKFKFSKILQSIKNKMTELSKEINIYKRDNLEVTKLSSNYAQLIEMLEPFIPATVKLIKEER